MTMKRLWIALLAIPVCLISVLIIGAQRSHPANAGGVIDPTCTSSSPCIQYNNNGAGPGILGISVKGNGLAGSTKYASTSVSGRAGLIGNDIGTGRSNSGVHGLSVNGTGVSGLSTTGAGVNGASNYIGVAGSSTGYIGVFGTGPTYGVAGSSVSGVGVYGLSTAGAANGIGVQGLSSHGVGVNAVGGGSPGGGNDFPALSIVSNSTNDLIDACPGGTVNPCDFNHNVFQLTAAGDIFAAGSIDVHFNVVGDALQGHTLVRSDGNFQLLGTGGYLKNGTCVAGCAVATATSAGRAVTTYAPMVSQPTIEDFGEAQLVNGQTSVRLDPKFANVVDQSASYLVFITPEGEANTLYVTEKSRSGFTVREIHGGRSTIAFSYRIVAKPFGSREARLPMVELPKLRSTSPPKQTRRFHP